MVHMAFFLCFSFLVLGPRALSGELWKKYSTPTKYSRIQSAKSQKNRQTGMAIEIHVTRGSVQIWATNTKPQSTVIVLYISSVQ